MPAVAAFGIGLSQDFDSGSLDVASSTVLGTTVHLVGRNTWTASSYANRCRWVYFRASDVAGLTPDFRISATAFLDSLADHRFVYSYDRTNWQFFDTGLVSSDVYSFGNHGPFTQDDVYVAYSLPYPVSRTRNYVNSIAASPYVLPTASGGGNLVIGQSAGGVDDSGRTILPHDLVGLKITNPAATGPKTKVLLAAGNHSGEPVGNYVLEGMTDFLLGDDPRAAQLRAAAEFYVYPQLNPDGRFAGYYRSGPENPDKDFNRYWNNPAGFTDLGRLAAAMQTDTGGDIDYLFDFHGFFGPWSRENYYNTLPQLIDSDFAAAFAALEPGISPVGTSGAPGMLRIWGASAAGLNADYAFTPETGAHPGVSQDRLFELGTNYALALHHVLVVPEPSSVCLLAAALVLLIAYRRKA